MKTVYIAAGTRTPFCKMGTSYKHLSADDLGASVIKSLIAKTGVDPTVIDEVMMGCVCQPVEAANVARVMALRAGLPETTPAITVHRNCASGLEAVTVAAEKILAGRGDVFLAGGVDSMTRTPFLYQDSVVKQFAQMARARSANAKASQLAKMNWGAMLKPKVGLQLGLTDPISGLGMGQTAEVLVRDFDITRDDQDRFAAESHQKALKHQEQRDAELTSMYVSGKPVVTDNGVREDSTVEKLGKLRAVFSKKHGSVTAGNASQITDGGVALFICSEEGLKKTGLTPIGRIIDYAYTGCDPKRMGLGPVGAIHQVNAQTGLKVSDADTVEINEAFAAQVIACRKALSQKEYAKKAGFDHVEDEIPDHLLNPYGGSIALGHPVGATGSRLVLTILNQLHNQEKSKGLASLCVGGGQGAAMWLEAA